MATPAAPCARKLACDLINEQFGDVVQKVCECLVNSGQLQLGEIARITGIALPLLRNCLLVLIQHNCVQAFRVEQEGAFGADPKESTYYIAILDNILHRMRFPKFLSLVQQEFGKEAESIVSGLLQHGRLTLEQLVKRAAEVGQTSDVEVDMTLKETFATLVRARYVERCPAPEPKLENAKDEQMKKKFRSAKSRAAVLAESPEQRVLAAAALMEAERFRVPASLECFSAEQEEQDASQLIVGQKRKHQALEMDASTMAAVDEKEVLWRVNYEEYLRRLRHQACVKFVRSRIDLGAGTILSCMLDATRRSEETGKQRLSDPLTMDTIVQAVIATPEGRTMTMERIRPALIQMISDGFVERVGEAGSQYVINMQKILDLARQSEIEGIVSQRYGRKSCRLFRLLSMKRSAEHKQISDHSNVESKETWELLYKLAREKYVEYQEVPKSADRAPNKTIYVWRVSPGKVARNVLNDMYHAAWNLGRRLACEIILDRTVVVTVQTSVWRSADGEAAGASEQAEQRR